MSSEMLQIFFQNIPWSESDGCLFIATYDLSERMFLFFCDEEHLGRFLIAGFSGEI